MKRYFIDRFALLGMLVLLASGCKDFFEPSLERRNVVLLSPADAAESSRYATGFWWEPVEDALSYRLQVVTPDFSHPVTLVIDTLVNGMNRLNITLEPGTYQWRLRAENGSSSSPYSVGSFLIHPASLSEQKLSLNLPLNNHITRENGLQLRWDLLFGANAYRLQIDTLNFADETKLVYNDALKTNAYVFNFPKDQVYQWRVRAENDTEQSKWSETRSVTYDHTAPGLVTPTAPANGSTLALPVSLTWNAVSGAKKYKVHVYKPDGVTPYTPSFPVTVNGTSYSFNLGTPGEIIYWRVSAVDEAGNEGIESTERNFTIQ